MWNIIKAQNYQIKRDMISVIGIIIAIAYVIITIISCANSVGFSELTGSTYLSSINQSVLFIIPILVLIVSTRIGGWDFVDKTINYEIMLGHSRKEVYFGRLIAATIWGIILTVCLIGIPAALLTMINGFGVCMKPDDMIIRYLLMLLPIIRIICGLICLCFITQNGYMSMIFGFLMFEFTVLFNAILYDFAEISLTYVMAYSNIKWLIADMNVVLGFVDGEDVNIYVTAVEPQMAISTIAVSVIVSVIYILIGYYSFKGKDQK